MLKTQNMRWNGQKKILKRLENLQGEIQNQQSGAENEIQEIIDAQGISLKTFPIQFQKNINGIPYLLVRRPGDQKTFAIDGRRGKMTVVGLWSQGQLLTIKNPEQGEKYQNTKGNNSDLYTYENAVADSSHQQSRLSIGKPPPYIQEKARKLRESVTKSPNQ